jgi:glycosyltransferase involved in cell wall biosynthesis
VRVALITEGSYPYRFRSASTWCHQLVRGLGRYPHHLVALTGTGSERLAYPLPSNVAELTELPVWREPAAVPRRPARRVATGAAVLLCRGLLGETAHDAELFRDGLRRLAQVAAAGVHPLAGVPLADVLLDAWRATGGDPTLRLHEAEAAAVLLEHALRPLAAPVPQVEACHATSAGLPLLVALAGKWRAGVPYLLTEHGSYLRERYLDYRDLPAPVRTVMLRFLRALARLGYAEAATVAAGSRFVQRWQLRHGADPARVVVVPGGVDPATFPRRRDEPDGQTVVWVGRIEPLKDLHTLLHAFWRVHQELPAARLRLVGPAADQEYEASCRTLVRRLDLAPVVEFAGAAPNPSDAYAAGQVVARTSVSEGMPFPVMEAMMTGRPVVCADVGGVAELVGDTGRLVPPGDPVALATELVKLLRDRQRRRALGEAAHRRARGLLTLDRMLRAYDRLYDDLREAKP